MKTIVGLMDSHQQARSAIFDLINSGFQRDAINIMANDTERHGFMSQTTGSSDARFSGTSAQTTGSDFNVLPIGTQSLTGMGVDEDDAEFYAEGVNRGGFLVTVSADGDMAERAAEILRRNGAIDIDERAHSWRQAGWTGSQRKEARGTMPQAGMQREGVIPVAEEELQVGKRAVQTGGVRVYSHVVSRPVDEEIRLREEHATIERRPVDRAATEAEREAFQEKSFEVREMREEPVVSKQVHVTEEVLVGKEASERTEHVRDSLRHTEVDVQKMDESSRGRVNVSEMDDEEFDRHFRSTYGLRGEGLDETYRSAYRFADAESSTHPEFAGKAWPEVEEDFHRDWERSHPGTWTKVHDAIHFGFDRRRKH